MSKKIDGKSIAKFRSDMGANQKDFWSILGVTQSGGSRYENGRNIPRPVKKLFHLVYIAKVVSPDSRELAKV